MKENKKKQGMTLPYIEQLFVTLSFLPCIECWEFLILKFPVSLIGIQYSYFKYAPPMLRFAKSHLKGDAKKSRRGLFILASIAFVLGRICLYQQKIDINCFPK